LTPPWRPQALHRYATLGGTSYSHAGAPDVWRASDSTRPGVKFRRDRCSHSPQRVQCGPSSG
jgi:hypothetical protein